MLRWIVRALLVVTLVVVVILAVDSRHQGVASADRLVVDQAAQASSSPAATKVAPGRRVARAETGRSTPAAKGKVKTKTDRSVAACAAVTVPHEIVVDIRRQQLWACHGPQLVFSSKVTTGAVYLDEATPDGTWQIYAKQTHRWLSGPGYDVEVNYWMPFYGGYGIHDAPWQTMPYGTDDYLARGSHGCVQVPGAVMARLYAWAPVGATVHVED